MSGLAYLITTSQARVHSHGECAGQAAFNALADFDPALAVEIAGSDADPFYDDGRLREFWLCVADALGSE